MSFNNGLERKLFETEWEKKKAVMIDSGMSEEAIQKMYEYDWDWYKSVRRYQTHTVNVHITTEIPDKSTSDTYEGLKLIEQLEDLRLIKALRVLKINEIEMLEKIIVEEKKLIEIAREQGTQVSKISELYSQLKEKIRNHLKK